MAWRKEIIVVLMDVTVVEMRITGFFMEINHARMGLTGIGIKLTKERR
jgi:hypothetical protein